MDHIQVTARCTIRSGKLDAFKQAAADCLECVREKDAGTLQYDWYFSDDMSQCLVRERYRDSGAVLEHMGNLGDLLSAFLATCDIFLEICGDPSPELREAMSQVPGEIYSFYQGL